MALFLHAHIVRGQEQKKAETPAKEEKPEDEGIPITSELVQKSCSSCHKIDEKKRMSRISYRRTTPEGWQQTIKRMVSLNKLQIEPEAARAVLKYLSNSLGLAPEEARPGAFEVEKRMIDYKYSDKDTEQVCSKCHSMGRVILQRRTKEEWELLVAMHRATIRSRISRLSAAWARPRPSLDRTGVRRTTGTRWKKLSPISRALSRSRPRSGPPGRQTCARPGFKDAGRFRDTSWARGPFTDRW